MLLSNKLEGVGIQGKDYEQNIIYLLLSFTGFLDLAD